MNNLNALAFDLAKIYLRFYKNATGRVLFSRAKLKKSKWWMAFYKTVSLFSNKEEWDTYRFVEAQFSDKVVYPFQLATNQAWENYLEHRARIIEDTDVFVTNSCATVFNYVKKWSADKGFSRPDFQAFLFDQKENILRGAFTIHLFSVLKPFYVFYDGLSNEQQQRIGAPQDLDNKRAVIHSIPKLREKLKEVLGNDFA